MSRETDNPLVFKGSPMTSSKGAMERLSVFWRKLDADPNWGMALAGTYPNAGTVEQETTEFVTDLTLLLAHVSRLEGEIAVLRVRTPHRAVREVYRSDDEHRPVSRNLEDLP